MSEQTVENQNQALSVLMQAAQLAQTRGAFSLDEAGVISQAVALFTPEPPSVEAEDEEEAPEEETD